MAQAKQDETQDPLIEQLLALLRGGQAHATVEQAVAEFPAEHYGTVPAHLPYSAWQILEHLRIAQRDILQFSAPPTGGYHGLQWPDDYWPKAAAPAGPAAWEQTLRSIEEDRKAFEQLLLKPGVDLYKPFLWGDGQNLPARGFPHRGSQCVPPGGAGSAAAGAGNLEGEERASVALSQGETAG